MTDKAGLSDTIVLSLVDELRGLAKHLDSKSQYYSSDLVRRAVAALESALTTGGK